MKQAFEAGKKARSKGFHRVGPYYEVKGMRDGKRVDLTDDLNRFWLAGYDGQACPEK